MFTSSNLCEFFTLEIAIEYLTYTSTSVGNVLKNFGGYLLVEL